MEFLRVEPPGADLAYVRRAPSSSRGRRGALLFLHGLGDASSAFAQAIEAPAFAHFEIVLVDLLGHGSSDKPDEFDYRPASHAAVLFMALRKMGLQGPLHVVGYSLGGALAVELARFPLAGFESLILVEPALDAARMPFAKRVAGQQESEFIRTFPELLAGFAGTDSSEADRRWAETAAFASAKAFYRSARGLFEAAARGELMSHFRQVAKRKSLILSPATYSEWEGAREAEGAGDRVFLVDSPSRMPMYDASESFLAAVARALE